MWIFFSCYCLLYGSFQTFAASANLLIKPFGATDLDISIAAIFLIIFGAIGAIISSIYLKKTRKYRRVFIFCCFGSLLSISVLVFQLIVLNSPLLMKFNVGILGFFITPIVPMSYEIGCELAFPIGEAQITGLLNGGALVWAFISDSILTVAIGFDTKGRVIVFMIVLIIFIASGTLLAFRLKIHLKRKEFEESEKLRKSELSKNSENPRRSTEMTDIEQASSDRPVEPENTNPGYSNLQE